MSEEEIIKKANELLVRVTSGYRLAMVDNVDLVLQALLDLYNEEKTKNKKLDMENQALYESINCDDKNMLERLYKEEKEKSKKCEYYEMVADELYKNSIGKDKIKEIADDYDTKGYIEIAGAMRELLEERN